MYDAGYMQTLPARVEHVGHERRWRSCSRCIDDIRHYGRNRGCKGICDDSTGSGPSENLDLSRRIQNDITTQKRKIVSFQKRNVTHSTSSVLFSTISRTWSNFVVNKLSAVRIPPFGPKLYLCTATP